MDLSPCLAGWAHLTSLNNILHSRWNSGWGLQCRVSQNPRVGFPGTQSEARLTLGKVSACRRCSSCTLQRARGPPCSHGHPYTYRHPLPPWAPLYIRHPLPPWAPLYIRHPLPPWAPLYIQAPSASMGTPIIQAPFASMCTPNTYRHPLLAWAPPTHKAPPASLGTPIHKEPPTCMGLGTPSG